MTCVQRLKSSVPNPSGIGNYSSFRFSPAQLTCLLAKQRLWEGVLKMLFLILFIKFSTTSNLQSKKMTMVAPSPRNVEVLTHRTGASRRAAAAGDIESDSCFEPDDCNKKDHTKKQHHSAASDTVQQIHADSPVQQHSQQKQKRRKKRELGGPKQSLYSARNGIVGLLLILLGVFLFLFFASETALKEVTQQQQQHENQEHPHFQQFFLEAPTSCEAPLEKDDVEFTLVTQVSADRLWMMEHHCKRWKLEDEFYYPMSIAVLSKESSAQVHQKLRDFGCNMELLTVQVVPASMYPHNDYPVNILRNIALKGVKTSHVMYVDVDFWIPEDMSLILQYPEVIDLLADDPKATLVIPAFQLERQCLEWRECPKKNIPHMPRNLKELKTEIMGKQVSLFDPTNRGGHGSTKYKEWILQNKKEGDVLVEIDCFLSNRYEPYLVFRYCQELPPFQEAFTGYGKNKMTWVMQLRRMGYTFWQLGKGAFVIHYPHLDSPSRIAWNNAPRRHKDPAADWQAYKRGQMDQLFVEFRRWLELKVPDMTVVPFCENKLDDDARLFYDRAAINKTTAYLLEED